MAGTGKRADQKKSLVINLTGGNNYFGKDKALRKPIKIRLNVINVGEIELKYQGKEGIIDLTEYKILGEGDIKSKIKIKASGASNSAMEKIKKAGGEIIVG